MYERKNWGISLILQGTPTVEYMSAYLGAQKFFHALDYVFLMGERYSQHQPADSAEQQLTDRWEILTTLARKVEIINAYLELDEKKGGVKLTISLTNKDSRVATIKASFNERAELYSFGLEIG